MERFPPLRRAPGTQGRWGSRPHPRLTRGAPGSVADSRLCARSGGKKKKKSATSNKSRCLGSRQGSGWPSPLPVPGLREECVSWGEMPVSSEHGSASGEDVLKGRYSWSCIIDAATENVLDESIDPRPLSSVSTGGKHTGSPYIGFMSLYRSTESHIYGFSL